MRHIIQQSTRVYYMHPQTRVYYMHPHPQTQSLRACILKLNCYTNQCARISHASWAYSNSIIEFFAQTHTHTQTQLILILILYQYYTHD